MKAKIKLEINFESWFDEDREPKTKEEWSEFFAREFMPEGSVIGCDDGDHHDMIAISEYMLKCTKIENYDTTKQD